jgi:hypothetical protein
MNVAHARIVALGVECATIGLLGWTPNLTHSLFNDAKNGMQKEVFCKTRRFGSFDRKVASDFRMRH